MSRRRRLAGLAVLIIAVVIFLVLRPGHRGATAEASGPGSVDHPQLVDATARRVVAEHARRLLALQLSKAPAHSRWLASWAAAPQAPGVPGTWAARGFEDETIREIVMISSDGAAVRIHLSNLYGSAPLVIGRASVAVASSFGRLAGAPRQLTFNGENDVTVPKGASVVSDPVVMGVHALQRLAVSLYLPEATGPLTYHGSADQAGFLGHGDDVLRPGADWSTDVSYEWYLLTGVDTLSPRRYAGTVAAIGDSITAGYHSTVNTFGAWPDDLARRMAHSRGSAMAVIDEGISGNRLLNPAPCCGASALSRFAPDVLEQAGVRDVVLLEGTNDIGFSHGDAPSSAPHTDESAAAIIAAQKRIIAAAHQAGLKIFGATLLPFRGAFYWTPAGEAKREAVNHWILTSRAFDGVIDFARVMAEPGHPEVMNPALNSGDHLHPNNAGYATMARAVQLATLTRAARSS